MPGARRHGKGWEINYQVAGQRHYDTIYVSNRTEALAVAKIREAAALDRRNPPELAEPAALPVLCELIERDYRMQGRRTLKDLRGRLKHLKHFFGEIVADRINRALWLDYIDTRIRSGAAASTIMHERKALRRMLGLAVDAGLLYRVPKLPRLKEPAPRKGFCEAAEFAGIVAALAVHLRPVAMFGYFSGWRLSEIVSLRWEQIEREARLARLWAGNTKNGEGRLLPLEGELWSIVERQWTDRPADCPWVFYRRLKGRPQRQGDPRSKQHDEQAARWERIRTFYKSWRSACVAAECPGRIYHDLRRTAVRNFRRAGLSEAEAMALTGHKTRHVFERYNIVTEKDLRDAAWRAQAFMAANLPECGKSVAAVPGTAEGSTTVTARPQVS